MSDSRIETAAATELRGREVRPYKAVPALVTTFAPEAATFSDACEIRPIGLP